jgi:hypothetical protein
MEANVFFPWAKVRSRCVASLMLAVVFGAFARTANATFISIDDFSQPTTAQFFLVPPGNNSTLQLSQVAAGPIGGQRDMLFHVVGQAVINSASGLVGHDNSFSINALQLATNGVAPTVTTLQYSGLNSLNTTTSLVNAHALGGAGGIDLTGGGTNDRFRLLFLSADAQPTTGLDVSVAVTGSGGTSTASTIIQNSATSFNVDIPFTQLIGTAPLNHVDSITVTFNGTRQTPNIDFEIGGIIAVPEPASCLTIAIGGVLIGAASLRRRNCR